MVMKLVKNFLKRTLIKRQFKEQDHFWKYLFYKDLYSKCDVKRLSDSQYRSLKSYYRNNFGKSINPLWHEYYYFMTGKFDVRFMPDNIFYPYILPYLNDQRIERGYLDKNNYEHLFPEILQPRTILKNINGFYYIDNKPVTEREAIEKCSNLSDAIIKPALDTFQGWNVRRFNSENGNTNINKCSLVQLLELYKKNFIIQEVIQQHPLISSLNESSVNTIRIVTYRLGNNVIPLSCIIRVGRKGALVDNGHAGGYCCGIDQNGCLKEFGFICVSGEKRRTTDNGFGFAGFKIPLFDKIMETAQYLHLRLPYLRFIGWDFCLNNKDEIVLLEFNATPSIDIMQLTNGPILGDYTEEILKEIAKNNYKLSLQCVLCER